MARNDDELIQELEAELAKLPPPFPTPPPVPVAPKKKRERIFTKSSVAALAILGIGTLSGMDQMNKMSEGLTFTEALERAGFPKDIVSQSPTSKMTVRVFTRDMLTKHNRDLLFYDEERAEPNYDADKNHARVRYQKDTGEVNLCRIYNATKPVNGFGWVARSDPYAAKLLEKIVSKKEMAMFVTLHEFRHCAQNFKVPDGMSENDLTMLNEADADFYAIRAMEAKLPGTRIREAILSFRVRENGYVNALALKYMLDGRENMPTPAAMREAHGKLLDMVQARTDSAKTAGSLLPTEIEISKDKSVDPLIRDWAKLRSQAFYTMEPDRFQWATEKPASLKGTVAKP